MTVNIRLFACLVILSVVFSCQEQSTKPKDKSQRQETDQSITVSQSISTKGGTIEFGDGTLIYFPENALPEQMTISMSRPKNAAPISEAGYQLLQLEPSGLQLNTAAVLRLPYQKFSDVSEKLAAVFTFDAESKRWKRLHIIKNDLLQRFIEVEVSHFSWFTTIFDRPLDLVLLIPGAYLKKSDLIYALAQEVIDGTADETYDWFPGHAALYLGCKDANADINDGRTIIESSPPDGVQFSEHSIFINTTNSYHIYMGARRYDGDLTDEDRVRIAAYAIDKLGHGYSVIGEGNIVDKNYSCVGLTEAAYDDADKSIIPAILEWPFILPLEQYIRTNPVSDITVRCNEEVVIPAKGVLWDANAEEYVDDAVNYQLEISDYPDGATVDNNTFAWTPQQKDVGKTFWVDFAVTGVSGGETYSRYQSLKITVEQGPPANSVAIKSIPSGASVYLDGMDMKMTTPVTITDLAEGMHALRLYKQGFNEYARDFYIKDGQSLTIQANMGMPLPPLPTFTIDAPSPEQHVTNQVVQVRGRIVLKDAFGTYDFIGNSAILTLNGVDQEIPVSNGDFSQSVLIQSGKNTIQLRANSERGDTGVSEIVAVYGDFSTQDVQIVLRWNNGTNVYGSYTVMKDVDLHVYDAMGHHTYWLCSDEYYDNTGYSDAIANIIPDSKIDIDNTWGFGPETFTLSSAPDQVYTVTVHFYAGYDALDLTYANVEITLRGTETKTFGPFRFAGSYRNRDESGVYIYRSEWADDACWWQVCSFTMSGGLPKLIAAQPVLRRERPVDK